jgi:cytochrome c-type biogenesis protein CcmH
MRVILLVVISVWLPPVSAQDIPFAFESPEQEARYQALATELRCLVCQNQSLAESNAALAQDLRQIVYNMLQEGRSDAEIIDFLVARYGDFVLYRPPVKATTIVLWCAPFVLLIAALFIAVRIARKRARLEAVELPAADLERARAMLSRNENSTS